jgi:hypothetical protein
MSSPRNLIGHCDECGEYETVTHLQLTCNDVPVYAKALCTDCKTFALVALTAGRSRRL